MYLTIHMLLYYLYLLLPFYSTRPFQVPYPSLCLLPGYVCFTIIIFSQLHFPAKLLTRYMQTAETQQKFIMNENHLF